jgi:hypothetical protein
MMYGNTNQRRVDFVKERLIDISWGRKPDGDKYLDENGHKRPVPTPSVHGGRPSTSTLTRNWAQDEPPPPPWALADEQAAAEDYPYDRRPVCYPTPTPTPTPKPKPKPKPEPEPKPDPDP